MGQNWKYRAILRREELKSKLKIADEAQSKLKPKVIPESIFDRTLKKIPVSDRDKIAAWQEDEDYFSVGQEIVLRGSYSWYPIAVHLTTRFIPFALLILYVNS